MKTKNIQDVMAERLDTFTTELMHRARYVQGNQYKGNQYKEGSDEYKAYQVGFDCALAMVYIDLTGTPKTEGMLTQLVKEVEEEEREDFKNYLKMLQGCEPDSIKVFITEKWYELESLTPTSDVTEK